MRREWGREGGRRDGAHLRAIVAADRARKLAAKLHTDATGLRRFLAQQIAIHPDKTADCIVQAIVGALADIADGGGGTLGTFRTWKPLGKHIAQQFSEATGQAFSDGESGTLQGAADRQTSAIDRHQPVASPVAGTDPEPKHVPKAPIAGPSVQSHADEPVPTACKTEAAARIAKPPKSVGPTPRTRQRGPSGRRVTRRRGWVRCTLLGESQPDLALTVILACLEHGRVVGKPPNSFTPRSPSGLA